MGRAAADVPEELDAAIIFAPAGDLVVSALRALAPGGSVVCAGIHMTDIPPIPYKDLWHERQIRSVANLTRQRRAGVSATRRRDPGQDTHDCLPPRARERGSR